MLGSEEEEDVVSLAMKGKECLKNLLDLTADFYQHLTANPTGNAQSLEEIRVQYIAEATQLKEVLNKIQNDKERKLVLPDDSLLQQRETLRIDAYEKNVFLRQLIEKLRKMQFDISVTTSDMNFENKDKNR